MRRAALGALSFVTVLTGVFVLESRSGQPFRSDDEWARCAPTVAHGLGGIDQRLYTNSAEAFQRNYSEGFRIFELDLNLSSDGKVVAAHDWNTPSRSPGFAGRPTAAVFLAGRIYGRYHPLDAPTIVRLLAEHPDARFLLDLKADPVRLLSQLVKATSDRTVLARLTPLVQDPDQVRAVRRAYPFPSIVWALHNTRRSPSEILSAPSRFGITVVVLNRFQMTSGFLRELRKAGIVVYLSSVNTEAERELYREWGGRGVYTDFISPDSTCP